MTTAALLTQLQSAGQDFEWYPTTAQMVEAIIRDLGGDDEEYHRNDPKSILDVGAGDGRVLMQLAARFPSAKLYAIEKSAVLQQAQPDVIVPVGTDFYEQNLMTLLVDVTFSNPPYFEFETWSDRLIRTAHTQTLYLILPQRWEHSAILQGALKARDAVATIIHRDDFLEADRVSRAVVHVIRIAFAARSRWGREQTPDPFDAWFDANIDTFDRDKPSNDDELHSTVIARIRALDSIPDMVEAYNEDYARMEANYRAIFQLDAALLRELGVNKESVREGLKKRMAGLKSQYWEVLFERLDVITSRLTTKTKKGFLERLTGQTSVAFTITNAYAVVLWAIKAANQYFDVQTVELFRSLATHDGVSNYKSNLKTWERDGWRYNVQDARTHFKLDYRIVLRHYSAIHKPSTFGAYEYPGNLHRSCHEQIADVIAVLGNLGFPVVNSVPSVVRVWYANDWQDFVNGKGETVFQVKGFLNGNLHFRFMPAAIKALNIEAGRLLGWIRAPKDVVEELGYSAEEATRYFGATRKLGASAVKLLPSAGGAA